MKVSVQHITKPHPIIVLFVQDRLPCTLDVLEGLIEELTPLKNK
jgi:hypothetical protein